MVVNGAFLERLVLAALRLGGDAATEHVELRTIFEVGEPYMTVYDALLKSMHIQRPPRLQQNTCGLNTY